MVRRVFIAIALIFATSTLSTGFAQSSPSQVEEATVAFDIRVGRARDGEFATTLNVEEQLKSLPINVSSDIDIEKLDRVYGALNLPNDLEVLGKLSSGPPESLPLDIFVIMKFTDSESTQAAFAKMEEESVTETIGDKTYLKPNEGNGIQNILMHMSNPTTIELGTRNYLLQEKRMGLFSDGLSAAWKKVPDHAFRMAIDINGESELIAQAVETGKANSGSGQQAAMTNAYLDLIDNAENMRFSIDMDAANILVVAATGTDAEKAEELRSGLDLLMGTAKMGGKAGLQQFGPMIPPDVGKVANAILDSLKATADGTEVQVAIPKPEGFNTAIKTAFEQALQMIPPPMDMGDMDMGEMGEGEHTHDHDDGGQDHEHGDGDGGNP